jgi:hypothetical protein
MKYFLYLLVLFAAVGCAGWDKCFVNDQQVSCQALKEYNKEHYGPGRLRN